MQPRIEGALIVALTIAAAAVPIGGSVFVMLSARVTGVAGALAAVRLTRWRLWALRGRPDPLCRTAGAASRSAL